MSAPSWVVDPILGSGVSLRDYFIAHAPAEPQTWFQPVMPDAPRLLSLSDAPEAVRDELQHSDYEEYMDPQDMTPASRAWHAEREAARRAYGAWSAERTKQNLVQWPCAWADQMLKARQA
jgi:hypothetical protein